jgi:integrase
MASGVVRYKGTRGVVWRIRYVDASGRQVQETLGRAEDGWTRTTAAAELRARRVDVRREGLRKPTTVGFRAFAADWLVTYPETKGLKRSTREGYKTIVETHLVPVLGSLKLEALDAERIEGYVTRKRREGLSGRTVNRHLNVLSLILGSAVKRRLIRSNPVSLVDRPGEPRRRWRILSPVEVRAVEQGFEELIADTEEEESEERAWRETCRVVFLVAYGLGLRRGEILGLRWRTVRLADPDGATLRVEETFVRGMKDTPKSEAGERTIALGPRIADELFEHRGRTHYDGDDERVFVSPHRGTPLNPQRYADTFRLALAKAEIEGYVRPFHDGRHSAITNAAAAGTSPAALMARAGHSDFKTTQGYIDLAGERFRDEAELLERRLWGEPGTRSGYKEAASEPQT